MAACLIANFSWGSKTSVVGAGADVWLAYRSLFRLVNNKPTYLRSATASRATRYILYSAALQVSTGKRNIITLQGCQFVTSHLHEMRSHAWTRRRTAFCLSQASMLSLSRTTTLRLVNGCLDRYCTHTVHTVHTDHGTVPSGSVCQVCSVRYLGQPGNNNSRLRYRRSGCAGQKQVSEWPGRLECMTLPNRRPRRNSTVTWSLALSLPQTYHSPRHITLPAISLPDISLPDQTASQDNNLISFTSAESPRSGFCPSPHPAPSPSPTSPGPRPDVVVLWVTCPESHRACLPVLGPETFCPKQDEHQHRGQLVVGHHPDCGQPSEIPSEPH